MEYNDCLGNQLYRKDIVTYQVRYGSWQDVRFGCVLDFGVRDDYGKKIPTLLLLNSEGKKVTIERMDRTVKVHPEYWNDELKELYANGLRATS